MRQPKIQISFCKRLLKWAATYWPRAHEFHPSYGTSVAGIAHTGRARLSLLVTYYQVPVRAPAGGDRYSRHSMYSGHVVQFTNAHPYIAAL